MKVWRDRTEAGRDLGRALLQMVPLKDGRDAVVLALPRGGLPVASAVAAALGAPLDVFVVRKLGAPGHEELAIGAIASGGARVLNDDVIAALGIDAEEVARVAAIETLELARRESAYGRGRRRIDVRGKAVVLVDDGLATGATMAVAIRALRARAPRLIVAAVPVAPREVLERLRQTADVAIALRTPVPFFGVGAWYADFSQTSDAEVLAVLDAADARVRKTRNHQPLPQSSPPPAAAADCGNPQPELR